MAKMYSGHTQKSVHLTYNIRQALERLQKEEEEVPGFKISNKLSPTRENRECTAARGEKSISEGSPLICVKDCHKECKEENNNNRKED